jgi:microcystin degradation protein MlrC
VRLALVPFLVASSGVWDQTANCSNRHVAKATKFPVVPKTRSYSVRIGVAGLLQESNTFLDAETDLQRFRDDVLATGDEIRRRFEQSHHELGGFLEELARQQKDDQQIEVVPLLVARALPYGCISDDTYEQLCEMLEKQFEIAGSLDGVLVACHGANVAKSTRDADGDWLARIRRRVGNDTPIISTLDPHATLSRLMVEATNALIAYRTNPHIDQHARGVEAARLLMNTLRGEVKPTQAACFPPLAMSIDKQATSESPCREFYQHADAMLTDAGILSNSIILGFPYADVVELGSAVIVVTDDDREKAEQLANNLGKRLWQDRESFACDSIGVDSAIDKALTLKGPVCLLDMGDNVGGGSSADGTTIAHALHSRGIERSVICLFDPEVVQQARQKGAGASADFVIGGKTDLLHGEPLTCRCQVVGVYDGKFSEGEPRHGGFTEFDQGETVVLMANSGLTIVVTSERMVPFSLGQLTSCELDPASYHILVAKGVNAPIAAYEKVCSDFIRVDTIGVTAANMTKLEFENRRRPLFPFEKDFAWD